MLSGGLFSISSVLLFEKQELAWVKRLPWSLQSRHGVGDTTGKEPEKKKNFMVVPRPSSPASLIHQNSLAKKFFSCPRVAKSRSQKLGLLKWLVPGRFSLFRAHRTQHKKSSSRETLDKTAAFNNLQAGAASAVAAPTDSSKAIRSVAFSTAA